MNVYSKQKTEFLQSYSCICFYTTAVCVYKGLSYTQGQQWYDGCDYTCTCEDAMQGVYRCSKR